MYSMGVAGCEDKGPPPGVGGRTSGETERERGDEGDAGGAGIPVPAVRERLMGVS